MLSRFNHVRLRLLSVAVFIFFPSLVSATPTNTGPHIPELQVACVTAVVLPCLVESPYEFANPIDPIDPTAVLSQTNPKKGANDNPELIRSIVFNITGIDPGELVVLGKSDEDSEYGTFTTEGFGNRKEHFAGTWAWQGAFNPQYRVVKGGKEFGLWDLNQVTSDDLSNGTTLAGYWQWDQPKAMSHISLYGLLENNPNPPTTTTSVSATTTPVPVASPALLLLTSLAPITRFAKRKYAKS